jgi:hypothetical protein
MLFWLAMDENRWNTKFSGEPHKSIPIPARCRTRAPDRVLHDFIFWGCGCVSARASPCSAFMRLIDWRVAGFLGGEVPHFWGLFQANSGTQNGIKTWAQVVSGGVSSIVRHRILNHKVKWPKLRPYGCPIFFGGSRCPDWQAIPLWLISDKALGGLGLSEARGIFWPWRPCVPSVSGGTTRGGKYGHGMKWNWKAAGVIFRIMMVCKKEFRIIQHPKIPREDSLVQW